MPTKAAKPSYYELLRHPKWQKKRLEVMERAGFACEDCGDTEETFNVHHCYYTKGAMPWEYPDFALTCLCDKCHELRHADDVEIRELLALAGLAGRKTILGFLKGLYLQSQDEPDDQTFEHVLSYEEASGVALAYMRSHEETSMVISDLTPATVGGESRFVGNERLSAIFNPSSEGINSAGAN